MFRPPRAAVIAVVAYAACATPPAPPPPPRPRPIRSAPELPPGCSPTLSLLTEGTIAVVGLRNRCNEPLRLLGQAGRGEQSLDWFRFRVVNRPSKETRTLLAIGDGEASPIATLVLEPGRAVEHRVDVVKWAAREINGATPISPGMYDLFVSYEVREPGAHWRGRLEVGPASLFVRP